MRCPNPEAHEPHWHVIRVSPGITVAQGQCEGTARLCDDCDQPGHTDVDYDDCVRAHQPDTDHLCACPCMENYEPTDEQLWAYAQRGVNRHG